jgi:hypothetical protein
MPEPAVVFAYVVTYGAIIAYAGWLEVRRRRLNRRG